MDDDDIRTSQLVPAGDPAPDEGAVVDEQLEIEPGRQPARLAVASRGLVDAPQPAPEGNIGGLDRVEEQRPLGTPVLDEQERAVASNLASRNGGSRRPTIVSSRSPAMAGACSISLPDR